MMQQQQQQQQQDGQRRTPRQPDAATLYRHLARLLAQGYHRASSSQSSSSPSTRNPSTLASSPPLLLAGWRSQLQDALRHALSLPRPSNREEEGGDQGGEDEERAEWFWNALAPPRHRHHRQHQHHTRGGGGHGNTRDGDDALSQWSCPAAVASGLCDEVCRALLRLQQSQQNQEVAGRVLGLLLRHVAAGGGEAGEGEQREAGGGGGAEKRKRKGLGLEGLTRGNGGRSVHASSALSSSNRFLVAVQSSLALGFTLPPAQLEATICPCFFLLPSSLSSPSPFPVLSSTATTRLLALARRLPQQLSVPMLVALLRVLRHEEEKLEGGGGRRGRTRGALEGQGEGGGGGGGGCSAKGGSTGAGRAGEEDTYHHEEQQQARPQHMRKATARQRPSSPPSPAAAAAAAATVPSYLDRVLQLFLGCLHDMFLRGSAHIQDALTFALQETAASFAPSLPPDLPPSRPSPWVLQSLALLLHVVRPDEETDGFPGAGREREFSSSSDDRSSSDSSDDDSSDSDSSSRSSASNRSTSGNALFSHPSCLPPSSSFPTTHAFLSSLAVNHGMFSPAPPKSMVALPQPCFFPPPPPPSSSNKIDPVLVLPPAVALHLLSFLNPKRLAKAEAVSPAWNHLLYSPLADTLLWRPLLPLLLAPSTAEPKEVRQGGREYWWERGQGHRLWREMYQRRNKAHRYLLANNRWRRYDLFNFVADRKGDTEIYAPPLLCGAAFLDLDEEKLAEWDGGGGWMVRPCLHCPEKRLFRLFFMDLMRLHFSDGSDVDGEVKGHVWASPRLCQQCGGLQELPRWPGKEPGAKDWWDGSDSEEEEDEDEEDEDDDEEGGAGGGKTEIMEEDVQDAEKEEGIGREERAARACMLRRYMHIEKSKSSASSISTSTSTSTRRSTRTRRSSHSTLQSKPLNPSTRWKDLFSTRWQRETSLFSSFKQGLRAWRAVREREDAETWEMKKGSKRVAKLSAAVEEKCLRRVCRVVGCLAVVTQDNIVEHTAWHRAMARSGWRKRRGGQKAGCKGAGKSQRRTGGGGGGK